MILLIDNYDSFVYNLYQLIGSLTPDLKVIRNDACSVEEVGAMKPDAIVISPGPGRPEDAGIILEVIRYFTGKIPILGVCLGHQAICMAHGGAVVYAKELMHGKTSMIFTEPDSVLFSGIEAPVQVARYHSLAAAENELPDSFCVTARTADREVMAVEHREYPVYGVQFHPESIMTPQGKTMIRNFLKNVNL